NPTHQTLIIKDSFLQKDTIFTSKDPFLYSVGYPTLKRPTLINCPFDCDSAETQIVGSCDGLLCLADGIAAYIFNLATRKHRVLPVSPVEIPGYVPKGRNRLIFGFGYDYKNDDYKLVRIIEIFPENSDDHISEMKVYSLKTNTWKTVSPVIREFPYNYYIGVGLFSEGVFLNGCLHWLVVKKPISEAVDVLVALDIGTEEHGVLPIPEYNELKMDYYSNVGVIDGCITIRVFYPNHRLDVWIMKEYGVKESWTKWFSISQWESIGFFSSLKPIVYLNKNGSEELLFEKDFKELVWFDVKRQSFKNVNTRGLPWSFASALLVESLVPLDSPKEKKPNKKSYHNMLYFSAFLLL
ncbi:F-box protein CPR30-like, partial [Chenopodium quinoa]|uniref:F-box protein CPR30-like n=1 Tax=Chenopodium quinoa TaxID=63459 RepID=UPI000B793BC3